MNMFGMWHRPFEHTLDEVHQTMESMKSMSITDVFVETFFNGRLIFDSEHAILEKHDFVGHYGRYGADLLLAFIETGRSYGITIHAWVENFFIGRYDTIQDIPMFEKYQSYFIRNRDGSILQKNEVNYLFMDPAHPDVKKYLVLLYRDIQSHRGLGSLHLDYIRYPLSYRQTVGDLSDDNGYTSYALRKFQKRYDLHGDVCDLIGHHPDVLLSWQSFKVKQINNMVRKFKKLIPDVRISTAVFGNPDHAKKNKMQDWSHWVRLGWIDFIVPMAYYKQPDAIHQEIRNMRTHIGNMPLYAGLAPGFIGLSIELELESIKEAMKAGADGIILFASQNYLDRHFNGTSDQKERRSALRTCIADEE